MQITLLLYICVCKLKKKKTFTQHLFTTFSIDLSPSALFYKWKSVLTFCYLEYMLPLLLFFTVVFLVTNTSLVYILTLFYFTFISLDVRPLRVNHFMNLQLFVNNNNGTATTLDWSVNIWFGKWWQLTVFNPALPGTNCSMQMLTDWSRTRFLNVVFTSNIISSHVET